MLAKKKVRKLILIACSNAEKQKGTLLHALWECPRVSPIWNSVLSFTGGWLKFKLPESPRLCLLGHRSEVPQLDKAAFRVLNTGLVTCARLILMLWKEPRTPTLKMWRERLIENAACEKMLGRLNCKNEAVTEQWDSLHSYYPYKDQRTNIKDVKSRKQFQNWII
uniref:Uncharacterized protein n=1 Tax=Amphilophus citrinellus TaxID=61819 RepID=A0A3Q0S1N1_AMPCI